MVAKNKTKAVSKTTEKKITKQPVKKLSKKAESNLAPTELWARLNNNPESAERKYSIAENYLLNDKIIHPAFGVGFVRQILEFHRLEVLFADKSRVLVQNK
jgi:hypothetical protein